MDNNYLYTIYKITNVKNGKIYVGQTRRPIYNRLKDHISHALNSKRPNDLNVKLYVAIREFGPENFLIEPLETIIGSWKNADRLEIEWIAKLDSTNPEIGYNTDKGGHVISEKCRQAKIALQTGSKLTGRALEVVRENGKKHSKKVCQYTVTGEFIAEFPSIIEASRSTGCDRRSIQRQLKGEYNTGTARSRAMLKYIWKYKEEDATSN
mgnify:CR=1 FL=1